MGTLVELCKQRTDNEGQEAISDTEWKRYITTQYAELYSTVASSGLRYFEVSTQFTTDGGNVYDEPSDHLSTVGLDYIVNAAGERRELIELMAQERNIFAGAGSDAARAYSFVDDELRLYPTPPAGQTYELLYVPQPPDMSAYDDATLVDVVTPDGEAFLIWGVAVQALAKEESDTGLARAERDAAKARVAEWAVLRALNAPRRAMGGDSWQYEDPADYWGRGGRW
jgi:hypothetical protein